MQRPRILAVSSFVARGSVGLRAISPALTALGCESLELPTVVLSNHPGYRRSSGNPIEPSQLSEMVQALDANGWLSGLNVITTGYLPSAKHVHVACDSVRYAREKSPQVTYLLDPIVGDDPKGFYVEEGVALAIRDELLEFADVVTPNRFELSFLAGRPVGSIEEAVAAARALNVPAVVATSIPAGAQQLATVLVTPTMTETTLIRRRPSAPHGTGDLLAGLLAGHLALGRDLAHAFRDAHAMLARVIAASGSGDLLDLSPLTRRSQ